MGCLRLVVVILGTFVFAAAVASCGDDTVTGQRSISPTPRPAPTLEGRVVDNFAPGRDDRVAVIGVPAGETLSMRAQPGLDKPVITELAPTTDGLFGYGESFETSDGRLWWLVRTDEAQGWIEPGAAYLASPVDVSANAPVEAFDSTDDLVAGVTATYAGDPVIVDRSDSVITVDVLAQTPQLSGWRLVIEVAGSPGAEQVGSVTEIVLCRRGLSDDGRCV